MMGKGEDSPDSPLSEDDQIGTDDQQANECCQQDEQDRQTAIVDDINWLH